MRRLHASLSVALAAAMALASMGMPAGATTPSYRWTLSNSVTDPFANVGPLESSPTTLYLWFLSPTQDGMTSAEFALSTPDSVTPLIFSPYNGFVNSGGVSELRLSVGLCPTGPVIAGSWLLSNIRAGDYCLVTSSQGHLDTADCAPAPAHWPIQVTCYHAGSPPANVQWSVSTSASSPDVVSGPLTPGGLHQFYLWYESSPGAGMADTYFRLQVPSNGLIAGLVAMTGFSAEASGPSGLDIHLQASGCPMGPVVAAVWSVFVFATGGQYCLVPDSAARLEMLDCLATLQDVHVVCYDAGSTAVEEQSWGRVKSAYRAEAPTR